MKFKFYCKNTINSWDPKNINKIMYNMLHFLPSL